MNTNEEELGGVGQGELGGQFKVDEWRRGKRTD